MHNINRAVSKNIALLVENVNPSGKTGGTFAGFYDEMHICLLNYVREMCYNSLCMNSQIRECNGNYFKGKKGA